MAESLLASSISEVPLHLLGWKAFQDLCVNIAEECLQRPVQSFLPNNDAGRDGAFVGRWLGDDPRAGESTIQCKFTSKPSINLTLSMLSDELSKAERLAEQGLAEDYIILTNHPVTGASDLAIKKAFKATGVGNCRVFGHDWIVRQISSSPRLRMMTPRLYGLGDLGRLLDARAYEQAQLILSALGNDLQKLVVTDAHRQSVRAVSDHGLVLLLGAPATGKSTIGASLAVGAADIWNCSTIRANSPDDILRHLDPSENQFFWIDDAWGNTQYQRQHTEEWNQVFPLIQGAISKGTRFLITSRDYVWNAAKRDLKLHAIPVLSRSQVVINVEKLTVQERAQILYNHIRLGDQPIDFRRAVKEHLPAIAERRDFLPETARRFGSTFFARPWVTSRAAIHRFFERPDELLVEIITGLSADCQAAVAVIFLNGGTVRSPVGKDSLAAAADAFGTSSAQIREQLTALKGSLLQLAQDEHGPYWTYKHPSVSDAFAKFVSSSPELIDVYLTGAKPASIASEVVCAGVSVHGAPVVIPDALHQQLASRFGQLTDHEIVSFVSYRSNAAFSKLMLETRPALLDRPKRLVAAVKDDLDFSFASKLHEQNLLPESVRKQVVAEVQRLAVEEADASFLDESYPEFEAMFTAEEIFSILVDVEDKVICDLDDHVDRLQREWDEDTAPEEYFEYLEESVSLFLKYLEKKEAFQMVTASDNSYIIDRLRGKVASAVEDMYERYRENEALSAPTQSTRSPSAPLIDLFRDVDS